MRHAGIHLKKCREEYGVTQVEVALHLGYDSPQFISNVERGVSDPPLKSVNAWCKFVGADKYKVLKGMVSSYHDRIQQVLGL